MREILIISGKGGAGKTSVTAALAHVSKRTILCDLDVDAPDMHLLATPTVLMSETFVSGNEAIINAAKCTGCGVCEEVCVFGAIRNDGDVYRVDALRCEGCKVCVTMCPAEAIDFPNRECGNWYRSETRFGPMIHAQLHPGEENSGRLVTLLKQHARSQAKAQGIDTILADGAPGIGCPVISSLSGADIAVLVTEPTPSGIHDLERVAQLCKGFRIPVTIIINKYDINPEGSEAIETLCRDAGWPVICHVPHDKRIVDAMVQAKAVTEVDDAFHDLFTKAWNSINHLLDETKKRPASVKEHV